MKNEKGIALLITLFAIMIMIFLAVEIGYNTHVELKIGAAQVDRLKAYYLAKAGVQLSILRINAYKTVSSKFGQALGSNKADLDLIWQFPFTWPPIIPEEANGVDKAQVNDAVKKSTIDGTFSTAIEPESGKIDINDLDSPSQTIQKATNAELVQILQNKLDGNDDWAENHRNVRPQEIINNIADWIDQDDQSRNGGSESSYYNDTKPQIRPPNHAMKTLDELHMVAGVTDDIYNVLAPRLTLWGEKGINVNYAAKDVLRSIDPQISDKVAQDIIDHRTDQSKGPFAALQDFLAFLNTEGVNTQTFNKTNQVPITFDAVSNFKIKSTGIYGKAQREIVAIVYDFDKVKGELLANMATPSPTPGATPTSQYPTAPTPTPSPTATASANDGVPQIVFWQEY
jgi:general secretion pathway protein K